MWVEVWDIEVWGVGVEVGVWDMVVVWDVEVGCGGGVWDVEVGCGMGGGWDVEVGCGI